MIRTELSGCGRGPRVLWAVGLCMGVGCGSSAGDRSTAGPTQVAVQCVQSSPQQCFEAAKAVLWGQGYDLGVAQRYLDVACQGDIGAACRELGLVRARATASAAGTQEAAASPARSPQEVEAYERACLLADGQGCHELGLCHLDGGGCEADPGRAFERFGQGCELAYADACLEEGDLIAQDPSLSPRPASDFYKLGCGHGALAGCEHLAGAVHGSGSSALAQDMSLQVVAIGLENGCNRQLAQSCYTLGQLYDRGWGVGADPARSQALVDMACRMGYAPACHENAARKMLGYGAVAAEPETGMTLLAELCQTGYVPSCASLLEYAQTIQGAAASLEGVDLRSPSDIARWTCQLGYQTGCEVGVVLGP